MNKFPLCTHCDKIPFSNLNVIFFFSFIGSVFLERDLLIHETFGEIFEELNGQEDYLNGTRVDYDIQYTDLDQFDAYQKACMEMTFR